MPGKNNASAAKGKGFNKKNQFADKANKKVLGDMISEGLDKDSTRFARVTKMSGNSRILVDLVDGRSDVSALIRNVLRGRAATPIGVGSIVLIGLPNWQKEMEMAQANGGTLVAKPEAYVEAVIDRKTSRHFVKEGLIPETFLKDGVGDGSSDDDAGFDFDDGADDEVVVPGPATATATASAVAEPEDEEELVASGGAGGPPKVKWTGHGGKKAKPEDEDGGFTFE